MFDRIANDPPEMPKYLSATLTDLLTKLLKKEPEERLGYEHGFAEVKR